jgi:hypothetical protein
MNVDRYIGYSNPDSLKKTSVMNVYQYIAYSNTDAANELCKKHGYYQIQSYDELADCLQSIVAIKGESALKEIMELHPEKEVVIELFMKEPEPLTPPIQIMEQKRERDCSCMLNADGVQNQNNQVAGMASQTNLMILVAAIIVSISVISMKK